MLCPGRSAISPFPVAPTLEAEGGNVVHLPLYTFVRTSGFANPFHHRKKYGRADDDENNNEEGTQRGCILAEPSVPGGTCFMTHKLDASISASARLDVDARATTFHKILLLTKYVLLLASTHEEEIWS
jgi:hypothetical protein